MVNPHCLLHPFLWGPNPKSGDGMQTKLYHSVNSGLYFWNGAGGLLVDGLHGCGPYQCFSPMPAELRHGMVRRASLFAHLNGAVFSHGHGDHCDPDAMYFIQHGTPAVPCFLWGGTGNTLPFSPVGPGIFRAEVGGFLVYAIETGHNSVDHKHEALFRLPTCVFLIRNGSEQFLAAADGDLTGKDVERLRPFGRIDLAFCNSYHLTQPDNLDFFQRAEIDRLAIYHLPFQEDDVFLYRSFAAGLVRRPPPGVSAPFLLKQMAWFDDDRPAWSV